MRNGRTGGGARSGARRGLARAAACLIAVVLVLAARPGWSQSNQTYDVPPGETQTVSTPIANGATPTSVTETGGGTLILSGANTYTGATTINGGTLAIGAGGTVATSSGVDDAAVGTIFDISMGGNQTIRDLFGVGGSTVSLGGNTLTLGTGDATTFAGTIADGGLSGGVGGSIIKQGAGTLTLTGTNTYTGATTITAGTLAIGADGSISTSSGVNLAASGATFDVSNAFAPTIGDLSGAAGSTVALGGEILTLGTGDSTTFAGTIADGGIGGGAGGSIIKQGGGTLTLTGTNTYTGATTIDAGTLAIGAGGSIATSSGVELEADGAVFDISGGGNQTIGDLNGVAGTVVALGANALTLGTADSTTFAGVIANGGIAGGTGGSLVKQGTGTLTLTGTSTYSGATTIDAGTLAIAAGGSIASSSGVDLAGAGATFDISAGGNQTIQDLTGVTGSTLSLGANTLMLGTADSTDFAGSVSGTGQLTKQGGGTLTLSGNSSSFAGTTLVTAGVLDIGPDSAPTASLGGSVTVENGAVVDGHGNIGGSLSNPSGVVIPFSSTTKTLSVGGNYTQGSSGVLGIGLSPTGATRLSVQGSATLAGTLDIATSNPASFTPFSTFEILAAAGGVNGQFTSFAGNIPVLPTYIEYLPNQIDLLVEGFTGRTPNEAAVASVLNKAFPTVTGDFANVLDLAVNLSIPEMQEALSSFGGQIYGNLPEVSLQDQRLFLGAMDERLRLIAGDSPSAAVLGSLPSGAVPGGWGGSGGNAMQLAALGTAIGDDIDDPVGLAARPASGQAPTYPAVTPAAPPEPAAMSFSQPVTAPLPALTAPAAGISATQPEGNAIADPVGLAVAGAAVQAQAPVSPPAKGAVWVRGFGQFGNFDNNAGALGSNFMTGGGAIGADLIATKETVAGIAVGGGQSTVSLNTNPENGTISFVQLGAYGARALPMGFAVDGAAIYSHDYYNVTRGIVLPGISRVATSSHDGNDAVVDAGVSRPYIAGGWEVTPRIGLSYYHIGQSAFSESGAGSLDLAVNPSALDALFARIGIAIAQPLVFEGVTVVPEIRLAELHNFLDLHGQFNASFVGSGAGNFTIMGVPTDTDAADLGVGLGFAVPQTVLPAQMSGFLQYDATWGVHELVSAVAGGVRVKW